jgi:hypothetical protein
LFLPVFRAFSLSPSVRRKDAPNFFFLFSSLSPSPFAGVAAVGQAQPKEGR